jgi:hypothetical protein
MSRTPECPREDTYREPEYSAQGEAQMAEVIEEFVVPPLAPDQSLDLRVYYDSYSDTLVVSFYGRPKAGMNASVGDESIELRITLEEDQLLGLEIPGFTYAFLLEHPEFLDFAATAGVSTEKIESIRSRISTTKRQHSAVSALLRQFAGVDLTP